MPRPAVFLSYSRRSPQTGARIDEIEKALAEGGFRPLRDQAMATGRDWQQTLDRWLAECHGAVIVLDADALESAFVRSEVEHLMRRRRTEGEAFVVVPMLCDGVDWADVTRAFPIARIETLQGSAVSDVDRALQGLARTRAAVQWPEGLVDGRSRLPPRTPAGLLRAASAIVPFLGREQELSDLSTWLGPDPAVPIGLGLLHGPGGAGKTRLAMELVQRADTDGWDAGFLVESADVARLLRGGPRANPLLVVVDYGETRGGLVRTLLDRVGEALTRPDHRAVVRLLLVARNAGPWWVELQRHLSGWDVFGMEPVALELSGGDSRVSPEQLWAHAVDAFGAAAVRAGLSASPVEPGALGPPADAGARPLYLQMAALDHVLRDHHPAGVAGRQGLRAALLDHEERVWRRWLQDRGHGGHDEQVRRLRTAAAALVLLGARDARGELAQLLDAVDVGPEDWLLDLLAALYPQGRAARPLEPDLLAEELVVRALGEETGALERVLDVAGADGDALRKALTVLCRADSERGTTTLVERALSGELANRVAPAVEVARETGEPMARVLTRRVIDSDDELVGSIARKALPDDSVVMRELGLHFTRQDFDEALRDCASDSYGEIARASHRLARRLEALGRFDEALTRVEYAIPLLEPLARHNAADERQLIRCLLSRGVYLDRLERQDEALGCYERAEALCRRGGKGERQRRRSVRATLLGNLAIHHERLGNTGQAKVLRRRATRLTARRAERGSPRWAGAMERKARTCRAEDDLVGAREAGQLALGALAVHAANAPDRFLPRVARMHALLAGIAQDLDDVDGVRKAGAELVHTWGRLGALNPRYFLDQADQLVRLGNFEQVQGQPQRARAMVLKAAAVATQAAAVDPLRAATVLNHVSNTLLGLGSGAELRGVLDTALALLADRDDDDARLQLAYTLNHFGLLEKQSLRLDASSARFEQALVAMDGAPDSLAVRRHRASLLSNLSVIESLRGHTDRALDLARQGAAAHEQTLASGEPIGSALPNAIAQLAQVFMFAGQTTEAQSVMAWACSLWDQVDPRQRALNRGSEFGHLATHGVLLSGTDDEAACRVLEEAIALGRTALQSGGELLRSMLLQARAHHVLILSRLGRTEECEQLVAELVEELEQSPVEGVSVRDFVADTALMQDLPDDDDEDALFAELERDAPALLPLFRLVMAPVLPVADPD